MLSHTVNGAEIRRLRELANMPVPDLADAARISVQYVYKIEQGRKQPSAAVTARIALALKTDIRRILTVRDADSDQPATALRESA